MKRLRLVKSKLKEWNFTIFGDLNTKSEALKNNMHLLDLIFKVTKLTVAEREGKGKGKGLDLNSRLVIDWEKVFGDKNPELNGLNKGIGIADFSKHMQTIDSQGILLEW